jgi:hypothetical protein
LAQTIPEALRSVVLPDGDVKSLDIPRVYRVYAALTDDYPKGNSNLKRTRADWWEAWLASRADRHLVAHRGAQMTQPQADTAIVVAERYIAHLTEKVDAALERTRP